MKSYLTHNPQSKYSENMLFVKFINRPNDNK